jgi:hypothetical protein
MKVHKPAFHLQQSLINPQNILQFTLIYKTKTKYKLLKDRIHVKHGVLRWGWTSQLGC